ncbi:MAG: alkaline phosphatase family protein, partial [Gammaproteobacteria bacterium]|nr:alkaline phosphatase family protein [Gammaproteobacteria bacterium]
MLAISFLSPGQLIAQQAETSLSAENAPLLLLIGIDGLKWDIIDRHPAPALQEIAGQGVRVQSLVPVMPSKTFPNFYAIATGLYPENNGVLDNATYDPSLDTTFRMSTQDDARWFQGEPIWITAEKQGVRTATMFWVGSAAEIAGRRPTYWHAFDGSVPNRARVQQVLDWVDLPLADRPQFISVYFEAIDSASHNSGVNSTDEREAVSTIDAAVANLMEGLQARGVLADTNVIVVGDHGMVDLSEDRIVYLDDYADFSELYSPQLSGDRQGNAVYAAFHGDEAAVDEVYAATVDAHPNMQVYRKGEFPDWMRLSHPQRGPDLVIVPDNGWMVSKRGIPYRGPRATHGFSPLEKDMHAAMFARGPAFRQGAVVDMLEVVDIYSIMTRVLGINASQHDGDVERTLPLFRAE